MFLPVGGWDTKTTYNDQFVVLTNVQYMLICDARMYIFLGRILIVADTNPGLLILRIRMSHCGTEELVFGGIQLVALAALVF